MGNGFTFGNHSAADFNMRVEKLPKQNGPKRKRKTVSVAGRNGDLHFDEDSFENYVQPYECYFHGDKPTPEMAHAIKEWLLSSGVYQRLSDAYDPNHFRLATFVGPINIDNILSEYGRCIINFDCAPQSFLLDGELTFSFTQSAELINPTAFFAKPIITVYGTGPGVLTVGDATVQIKALSDQITLDCDIQNAYRQVGDAAIENKNSDIYAPEFPELASGSNTISWTGAITKVEIIPRWWTV